MNPLKLPLDHRRRLDCGEGQSGPGRADGGDELILAVSESTFEIRLQPNRPGLHRPRAIRRLRAEQIVDPMFGRPLSVSLPSAPRDCRRDRARLRSTARGPAFSRPVAARVHSRPRAR